MGLTERRDLRGGRTSWRAADIPNVQSDPLPEGCVEVAIIGAGIMGASVAERLSAEGRRVAVLDRRPPAHGSTAASTALVMWGIDVPLAHLSLKMGFDEAARRWKRVFLAVNDLAARIDDLGLDCDRNERPELYLAGTLLDEAGLREEAALRVRAGLPSVFTEAPEVAARFGIAPRAALVSQGAWEVNPVKLTTALLERARSSGCTVSWPVDVVAIEGGRHLTLRLDDGRSVEAGHVVIAGGYERAPLFLPTDFSLKSSYAIATPRDTPPLWRERAMIWEASSTFAYARSTADGRIIAGGEDEDFTDPDLRDRLLPEKRDALAKKLAALASEGSPGRLCLVGDLTRRAARDRACGQLRRSLAGEWIRWERNQLCCPGGGDHRLGHRWEGRPVREVLRSLSLRGSSAVSLTPLPRCRHGAYPPGSTWRV